MHELAASVHSYLSGGAAKLTGACEQSAKQGVRGMSIRLPTHVWGPGAAMLLLHCHLHKLQCLSGFL